jgi:benzoate membrane transport protein
VLLRFGLDVFVAMNTQLVLALAMFATWLAGRRLFPRYAVIATLLVGIAVAASRGLLHAQQVQLQLAVPQWVTPPCRGPPWPASPCPCSWSPWPRRTFPAWR